ncbi:OLC1v1014547C1 [Oldenlandia corymbosa var. corymbosa]|uniref:OLC1v1014547C1 n=1 Tax=Oldenlandia corymbosa var. corymbosa TaxID=529605 RepID=A0AAV1E0X8_OLDCO|nr:OLC1v1014547C1 [Oldenlandia corymbosa var. corymbosa]
MASEANKTSGNKIGGGGFRAKLDHALYSGEKKYVIGGIAVIGVIFGVPWYLMNRGSKHQSHQDYMEKADKARNERLKSSSTAPKV